MPEQHLNGAYYGPSIPPPSKKKAYHRHSRGGGSSCNPFSCCCGCLCNCLWSCIFQILCTLVVVVGIVILCLWLVFRPNKVKIHATDAVLTEFNYSTDNSTMYYNLALNLTIRNPNKRIGIYYDTIVANALYEGQRLKTMDLVPFYQGHKNTTDLSMRFQGQQILTLNSEQVSNYNKDKDARVYNVDVKLNFRVRLKFGWVKSPKMKPKIECELDIPLKSASGTVDAFQAKQCHLDW